jgi:murein DD-endopeptidase MepM/ murein hydrolase activator NlpD
LQKLTGRETRATDGGNTAHRLSPLARINRRSVAAARSLQGWLATRTATRAASLSEVFSVSLRPLFTAERVLPIAVASLVAAASVLAVLPSGGSAVGATQGSGSQVRLAVNGGLSYQTPVDEVVDPGLDAAAAGESFQPLVLPGDNGGGVDGGPAGNVDGSGPAGGPAGGSSGGADGGSSGGVTPGDAPAVAPDQVLSDGTLVTGYAPNTVVEDGSALITTYRVRSKDTLSTIAGRYGISMMTLWWANKLKSKDALTVGMILRVPTADGLIVTVTANDTLDSLAAQYKVSAADIVSLNELTDPVLVVGQVLIMPGARGMPIPTPKPTPKPAYHSSSGSGSGHVSSGLGGNYTGGRLRWPVIGGGNYISQYFHYGHYGLDIAADYGSRVRAAGEGTVIFAGWKSNGGGYQVWISHGGNMYTTYNHMSAITVGSGQSVGRGQQVGRIGMTGHATGPHLHFEVWVNGMVWQNGQRVNPMRYL